MINISFRFCKDVFLPDAGLSPESSPVAFSLSSGTVIHGNPTMKKVDAGADLVVELDLEELGG